MNYAELGEPLRGHAFQRHIKKVATADTFKDHTRIAGNEPYATDLKTIYQCLESGQALPDHVYRKDADSTEDELLDTLGVKHLHLGGQDSDVLVFLMEFEHVVVILEINDHKHFRTNPVGSILRSLHDRKTSQKLGAISREAKAEADTRQNVERRKEALRDAKKRAADAAAARRPRPGAGKSD